jgi:hypothetical protein
LTSVVIGVPSGRPSRSLVPGGRPAPGDRLCRDSPRRPRRRGTPADRALAGRSSVHHGERRRAFVETLGGLRAACVTKTYRCPANYFVAARAVSDRLLLRRLGQLKEQSARWLRISLGMPRVRDEGAFSGRVGQSLVDCLTGDSVQGSRSASEIAVTSRLALARPATGSRTAVPSGSQRRTGRAKCRSRVREQLPPPECRALAFFLWPSLQAERRGVQQHAKAEPEAKSGAPGTRPRAVDVGGRL